MDLAGCQCERWMEAKNGSGAWLVYAGNSNESGVRAERDLHLVGSIRWGGKCASKQVMCGCCTGNGKREQREGKKTKRTSEGGCLRDVKDYQGNVFSLRWWALNREWARPQGCHWNSAPRVRFGVCEGPGAGSMILGSPFQARRLD